MSHSAKRPRLGVVEDDPTTRTHIVDRLVAEGFEVAHAVGSVREGCAIVSDVDGVLVDLGLPDGSGHRVIAAAHAAGVPALVVSVLTDDDALFGALEAGASGYCLKQDGVGGIPHAVAVMLEGGAPISPRIARRVLESFRREPTAESSLTPRELEVLDFFGRGSTYAEVGRYLEISVNTVRHHVRAIYDKLHVTSKAEAVALVLGRRS
jgi:DNA-binding NarL/FixJ family response regulator